jgi:hypothetical protein
MDIERLQALNSMEPFRPFILETAGGKEILISEPGHLALPPRGFDLVTAFAADGQHYLLTLATIASVEVVS